MLAASLVLGLLSAVAYGCSTAVQHAAVHDTTGRSHAAGLLALFRDARFLLSVGGDGLGLLLQVAALSTGPVILVQPLQVLALPVALPVRARLGAPPPTTREWWGVVLVVGGLAAFLLLLGDPGEARRLRTTATLVVAAGALVTAGLATLAVLRRAPGLRGPVFGALGGMLFAVVAVGIDETSALVGRDGLTALGHPRGWSLLLALVVAGAVGIALTQAAFQVGGLGVSYAAGVVVDLVLSVVLGAFLLDERLPLGPLHLLGYLVTLGVVTAGTVGLAAVSRPEADPA